MESHNSVNVCFFGVNRSLSSTIHSINQYLFSCLDRCSITYSVYGSFMKIDRFSNLRSNEFDLVPEQNESDLIDFDGLKHLDQGAIDDLIRWDHVFRYGDTYGQINGPDEIHEKNSTTKNIYRSLFCLKASYALIPPELRDRPTIFLRPDLEILSDIDLEFYLPLLFRKPKKYAFGETDGVVVLPGWHSWDGLNDRFAICSPGNASSTYANRFDQILSYLDISRHPIHPESYLLQILQAARVEILPIISTRMARIRANGVPQDEDFSKGSKSFELQSETLRALNDLIKQRDSVINDFNERLDQSVQALASQRDQLEKSSEEEISILSSQLESLKLELSDNLKERNEARESVVQLEKELDAARRISTELGANVLELETKLEDKCNSYDNLFLEYKALKVDFDNVKARFSSLEEKSQVTLLSFHQVQQELEQYFQHCNEQAKLLDSSLGIQKRASDLLSRIAD